MIKGTVRGQGLFVGSPVIVADTVNYLTAEFTFYTSDWNGLVKIAHFSNGKHSTEIELIDDRIPASAGLNLLDGVWSVFLTGHRYKNGELMQRITTTVAKFKVKASGIKSGEPIESLPSYGDRILGEVQKVREHYSDLIAEVQKVKEDYIDLSGEIEDLVNRTSKFVTPEMYGAKGDGITDDSTAWQQALNTGKYVIALGLQYYIGSPLTINNGNEIDCNGATFSVGGNALFVAVNTAVSTSTGSTYNKNAMTYDTGNAGFNGYCALVGANNPMPFRDYYKSGLVAKVDDGIIYEGFPVDIETPTLYFYNQFSFKLKNIGNIVFENPVSAVAIKVNNCYNFKIENITANAFYGYCLIRLHRCRNANISNICLNNRYNPGDNNDDDDDLVYPIIISESSYTLIEKCDIINQYWHCITTSSATNGIITCYTTIRNCILSSKEQFAYLDHSNTFGTTILNSTVDSICVYGMPTIKDCIITSYKNNLCKIRLIAVPLDELSCYVIDNVKFMQTTTNYNASTGIELYGKELGNTITKFLSVAITNINCATAGRIQLSLSSGGKYELRNIVVQNIKGMQINMNYDNVTVTVGNYYFEIKDSFDTGRMSIDGKFRNMIITNSYIKNLTGTFRTLKIANANISSMSGISGTSGDNNTSIMGCVTGGSIDNAAIMAFANVNLSDFCGRWLVKTINSICYEYSIDSDGVITATPLS